MSTTISVSCIDQVLTLTNTPVIASGGVEEDTVEFDFCPKWDGFTKTAVFYRDEEHVYNVILDLDDSCIIPQEVLTTDGVLYFGVFGVDENSVTRTSEILKYKIVKGAITTGSTPPAPTPSIYEQILAEITALLNQVPKTYILEEDD